MRGPDGRDVVAEALAFLPDRLRGALTRCAAGRDGVVWLEIRFAAGGPLGVVSDRGDLWVGAQGWAADHEGALRATVQDVEQTVQLVTRGSLYAWERELAEGFCTLPGGHRVGLAGRARTDGGRVVGQSGFTGVNLRLARAVTGAADGILHRLGRGWTSALIFGPPGAGKTTVLRDLCRQVSQGRPEVGLAPRRVVVIDERGELAACVDGRPQFDLGPRTDVLDAWPKRHGLVAALRALGPQVLACDELGGAGDAMAVAEASRCGVAVIATVHAGCADDLRHRPALAGLLQTGAFPRAVQLRADRTVGECVSLVPQAAVAGGRRPCLGA